MTMYLARWATMVDYECMRDDGGYDTLEDMASPSGVLVRRRTHAIIEKLKAAAYAEWLGEEEKPRVGQWKKVDEGCYLFRVNPEGEPDICLIIQKVEEFK